MLNALNRALFSRIFLLAALLCAGVSGWGQSRMPADSTAWLVSAYHGDQGGGDPDWYGDSDKVSVLFFEVDDTVTQPLYFGVYDPGIDGTDSTITPVAGDMSFRVYGGTGAYSDPNSRLLTYANPSTARAGNQLYDLSIPRASAGSGLYNDTWVYSSGILPSQGEHVGNKYIFKYVVVGFKNPDSGALPPALEVQDDDYFNRFQVAVSVVGSGDPVGISGVRVFAYSLCVSLENTAVPVSNPIWNLYPFVPVEPTVGAYIGRYIRPESYDGDYRNQPNATTNGFSWTLDRWNGAYTTAGAVYISGDNTNAPGTGTTGVLATAQPGGANGYTVPSSDYTGRTWRLIMKGGGESGGVEPNGADVWAAMDTVNTDLAIPGTINVGGGTALRIYAAEYVAPVPTRVVVVPPSQAVLAGSTAAVTLQLLDGSDNAAPAVKKVRVVASGGTTPSIDASGTDVTLTTNADGIVSFNLTNAGQVAPSEVVTLDLYTDTTGAPPSDSLPGPNATGSTVTFNLNPNPTISSAGNLTFNQGTGSNHPVILIKANGGTQLNTDGIRIRIPPALIANFTGTVPSVALTTGTGTLGAASIAGNILTIPISVALSTNAVVTIGSTTALAYTTTNSPSSGFLELSFDGGLLYPVSDDKLVSVLDPSTMTWLGTAVGFETDWANAANWYPAGPPVLATNVVIPNSGGFMPILSAPVSIKNLTVAAGASLNIGANSVTVSGIITAGGSITGTGSIILPATLTGSYSTGGGNLVFSSPVTLSADTTITTGAGTITFQPAATINGAFALTLDSSGNKTMQSVIGGVTPLTAITLASTGTATVSAAGGWQITGNTINAWGPVVITANQTWTDVGQIIFHDTLTVDPTYTFTLQGLDIDFTNTVNGNANSNLVIEPYTAANPVYLGGTDGAATLRLSTAELVLLNAAILGTLTLGTSSSTLTVDNSATIGGAGITSVHIPGDLHVVSPNTLTLASNIVVDGNILIDAGATLNTGGNDITVGGNWTNNNGTAGFGAGTGTVTFSNATNTAHSIVGNTTFYNLSSDSSATVAGATMTFTAGNTTTIAAGGVMTLQGAAAKALSLVSSSSPTKWNIVVNSVGPHTLDYLYITDSNLTVNPQSPTNSTGSNLIGWGFATNYVWSASTADTAWANAANWVPNGIPGAGVGDTVSIPTNSNGMYPILDMARSITDLTLSTASARVDLNGFILGVSGTFTNFGTIRFQGGEAVTFANDTANSGTVELYGANATWPGSGAWVSFANLLISGGGRILPAVTAVSGTLSISGGSLELSNFNLNVVTANIGVSGSGTLTQAGTGRFRATGLTTINVGAATSLSLVVATNDFAGGVQITAVNNLNLVSATSYTAQMTNGVAASTGTISLQATDTGLATLTVGANGLKSTNDNITLKAYQLVFNGAATITAGIANVYLLPYTATTAAVSLGGSATFNVTTAMLGAIYPTTTGYAVIGEDSAAVRTGGTVTVAASTTVTTAGDLLVSGTSIVSGGAGNNLTVNVLHLKSAGTIGSDAGSDGVADTNWLYTSVGNLRIDADGDSYINEANAVQLGIAAGGINVAGGQLNIHAGGAITTGNTVRTTDLGVTARNLTLYSSAGNITISNDILAANAATISLQAVSGDLLHANLANMVVQPGSGAVGIVSLAASGRIGADNAGDLVVDNEWIKVSAATLYLSAGAAGAYVQGLGSLALGDGSGTVATSANGPLFIDTAAGNLTIAAASALSTSGTLSLRPFGDVVLQNNITTTDDAIRFYRPVVVDAATVTVDSNGAGSGAIQFDSTVNSTATSYNGLIVDAGSNGITLSGIVGTSAGSTASPGDLQLISTAGNLAFGDVFTRGSQTYTTGGAGTITLNGSAYTVSGTGVSNDVMSFGGPVILTQASTTFTGGQGNTGGNIDSITFGGTVNGNAAGRLISIDSGDAPLNFNGVVGTGTGNPGRLGGINITQAGKVTFGVAVWTSGAISLFANDLDILGVLNAEGAGNLSIYSQTGAGTIDIGFASGTGMMKIDATDWGNIRAASAVVVGQTGVQSGKITAQNAAFNAAFSNVPLTINSDFGAGQIELDDTAGIALSNNGTGNITLNAGTNGLIATSLTTGGVAELSGGGKITLGSTGTIGTATRRIQFSAGQTNVAVSAAGLGGVYLGGLGNLGIGQTGPVLGIDTSASNLPVDISTIAGNLTIAQQLFSGTSDITLAPFANINLALAGTVLRSNGNISLSSPVVVQQNATILMNPAGSARSLIFGSTVDAAGSGTQSLIVNSTAGSDRLAVDFQQAIGAGAASQLASLSVTANTVSFNGIGTAVQTGVIGTTTITAATIGANAQIIFAGSNYRTQGSQSYTASPNAGGSIVMASAGGAKSFFTTGGAAASITLDPDSTNGTYPTTAWVQQQNGGDFSLGTTNANIVIQGAVRGTSGEDISVSAGSGSISLGQVGQSGSNDINTVSLSAATGSIDLYGDIFTDNQANNSITFTGPVLLHANITLANNHYIGAAQNLIDFSTVASTINSSGAVRNLTITASIEGTVSFGGAIGASSALGSLIVTGQSINLANIGTTPAVNGAASVSVTAAAAGSVVFNGTEYRTSGSQTWAAPTSWAVPTFSLPTGPGGRTFQISGAGAALAFTDGPNDGTILLGNGSDISLVSNGGAISVPGGIKGTSTENITINATGTGVQTAAIGPIGTNAADDIRLVGLTAPSGIFLGGSIYTGNAAGAGISLTGPVELDANGIVLDTDTAGVDGTIVLTSTLDAQPATQNTIDFNAGSSTVSVGAASGSAVPLGHFISTAATTSLGGNVTTAAMASNVVTITGNLVLAAAVVIDTDNGANDGNVMVSGTVNSTGSARDFQIVADTANVSLDGAMGGAAPILGIVQVSGAQVSMAMVGTTSAAGAASLIVNATGVSPSMRFNGTDYRTTGSQAWSGVNSLQLDTVPVGTTVNFVSATAGTGTIAFTSASGNLDLNQRSLSVDSTNGNLVAAGANVTFNPSIIGQDGTEIITVNAGTGGTSRFVSTVGTVGNPINSLIIPGTTGLTRFGADVQIANIAVPIPVVSIQSPVQLDNDIVVYADHANDAAVSITGTVAAAATGVQGLTIQSGTRTTTLGQVGTGTAVKWLRVSGDTIVLNGDIRLADIATAGAEVRLNSGGPTAVQLNASIQITQSSYTNSKPIIISGTVNAIGATAYNLALGAVGTSTSDITISGAVGLVNPLGNLTIDGNDIIVASIGSGVTAGVASLALAGHDIAAPVDPSSLSLSGTVYHSTGAQNWSLPAATNIITLSGGAATSMLTNANTIQISGTIDLNSQAITVDSTNAGGVPAGADITINHPIEATSGAGNVTITAGSGGASVGDVRILGGIGVSNPVNQVAVSGRSLYLTGAGSRSANQPQSYSSRLQIVIDPTSSATYSAGTSTFGFNPGAGMYIDDAAKAANIISFPRLLGGSMTITGNLYAYRGTLDWAGPAAATLRITGDLVVMGPGYSIDDPDRSPAINEFTYTGFTAMNTARTLTAPDTAFTGTGLNALTLRVDNNFYANGVSMNGAAAWILQVPQNDAIAGLVANGLGSGLAGAPAGYYAVAFYSAIQNCTVQDTAGLATDATWLSAGEGVTLTAPNSRVASFTMRPAVSAARTVYDNLLEVSFNQDIENSNHELGSFVGQAITNQNAAYNDGATRFDAVYIWDDRAIHAATATLSAGNNNGVLEPNENGVLVSVTTVASDATLHAVFGTPTNTDIPALSQSRPLYFQTSGTWNTDATGTGAGDGNSTNRAGTHQTTVPNLSFMKGRVFSALGKVSVANTGFNTTGAPTAAAGGAGGLADAVSGGNQYLARITAVSDACRPVLIGAWAGRSNYTDDNVTTYNGHNFLHLRYSEPMDLSAMSGVDATGAPVSAGTATPGTITFRSSAAIGFMGGVGTVTISGLGLSYPGNLTTGVRTGSLHDVDDDLPFSINSLWRSNAPTTENPSGAQGLTIFVAGYSFSYGGPARLYWPGFLDGLTTPNTDPSASANYLSQVFANDVRDGSAALNRVEPTTNNALYAGMAGGSTGILIDPNVAAAGVTNYAVNNLYGGFNNNWDVDAPAIARLSDGSPKSEIVSGLDASGILIDRFALHILDNGSLNSTGSGWDTSSTANPARNAPPFTHVGNVNNGGATPDGYANPTIFSSSNLISGVRDTSWKYPETGETNPWDKEKLGLKFESVGVNPVADATAFANIVTETNNRQFKQSIPYLVNIEDDPLITLNITTNPNWGALSSMWMDYDAKGATGGYIVDHAGNLMPSFTHLLAIERAPPFIDLALAVVNTSKIYIRFNEPVYRDQNASQQIQANDLYLTGTGTIPNIIGMQVIERDPRDSANTKSAYLLLDRAITPDMALDLKFYATVDVAPKSFLYDDSQNNMLTTTNRPFTDVGIDVATPVYALDDIVNPAIASDIKPIHTFDGTAFLPGRGTIVISAKNNAVEAANTVLPLKLFYDIAPPDKYLFGADKFWFPAAIPGLSDDTRTVYPNLEARMILGSTPVNGVVGFKLNANDPEIKNNTMFEFVMQLGSLPLATVRDTTDPTTLIPWKIGIGGVTEQRANVTILNNVIDAGNGEKTVLTYKLENPGFVTVLVFTLDNNLVRVLSRGQQASGSYMLTWDGTNMGGQVVARGMYIIRVTGPGFDETRKVMVVK